MDFIGYRHYKLLKYWFYVMGLTSYKPMQLRVVHTTIVCLLFFLGSTFTVFSLVENNCTSQLFSFQTSIAVLIANINITYGLLLVKSVNIKEWLKDIKRDWNHIQYKEEFKILKTCVAIGNYYLNIYLSKK
ncbi:uncharacterized protein LOC122536150 [Frieseomelitta varia]|uniref:uncharacterized protein LOC122536150 n=1 Tax=Frieseomelitta varia TaxID=561572 RepID=UPI001CB699B2|nr:uncharacterized protein LOC122536150 [Frieseomelitta varia]